jgi:hypothetical protein
MSYYSNVFDALVSLFNSGVINYKPNNCVHDMFSHIIYGLPLNKDGEVLAFILEIYDPFFASWRYRTYIDQVFGEVSEYHVEFSSMNEFIIECARQYTYNMTDDERVDYVNSLMLQYDDLKPLYNLSPLDIKFVLKQVELAIARQFTLHNYKLATIAFLQDWQEENAYQKHCTQNNLDGNNNYVSDDLDTVAAAIATL